MAESTTRSDRLARFGWLTLAANLLVIVWGAYVRASGSGAGCGNHWPLCNGTVIPQSPTLHTIVELTHRLTSGVALVLVLIMVIGTRKAFAPGHWARRGAVASLLLMFVEAGIGAGLVKFELVAHDASLARAFSLGAHLVNTQLLLAAILLTTRWCDGHPTPRLGAIGRRGWWFAAACVALMVLGMTGAIASLGDTLFPARTLSEGLAQDRDATAHVLLRLRVWHPMLAVVVGSGLLALAMVARRWPGTARVERAAQRLALMVAVQWSVGLLALVLLVPVALQLLHLLTADLLWLSVIALAAEVLVDQPARTTADTMRDASASNTVPAPLSR